MNRLVLKFFGLGQICLFVGLVVCIAIKPAGLGTDNGVSYYGTFASTYLPYAITLLGPATFMFLASQEIRSSKFEFLRYGFLASSVLLIVLAVTPYTAGGFVDWTHTIAGAVLFIWQLLISLWLVARQNFQLWPSVLAVIELAAGIVAAIYVLPKHGFLIQAQIIFQLAFGSLVIYSLQRLSLKELAKP